MPATRPTLEDYWPSLAKSLPEFSRYDQRLAVTLYRELAKGQPLTTGQIADALDVTEEEAGAALARDPIRSFVYVKEGRVAGFGGLATGKMHHEFRTGGRTLWTWCAWDSLFIPTVLGANAEVSSPDPVTGDPVRLTVSPRGVVKAEPKDAVVSFLLPDAESFDQDAENVMASFCHHVFFFQSAESGGRWQAKREGTFLYSLDEAFDLGQRLITKQFGSELPAAAVQEEA